MNSKSAVQEYFELRQQRNAINERLEAIQDAVIAELRQSNGVAHLTGYDLRLSTYVSWQYSPTVAGMQQSLNERKQEERSDGTAYIKERRDMLVLRSQRFENAVYEDSPGYDWEPEEEL